MDPENNYRVNSVDRACQILKCFSLLNPELTLAEISQKTGIPKPTAFRLLSTLEEARLVQRSADQQKYLVGIMGFELGSVYLGHLSVERIARPIMDDLTDLLGVTINLGMYDDGKVVYLATSDQPGVMRYSPIIGYRHYVHCSALGKILVSSFSESQVREILALHGMPALSTFTKTQPEEYLEELKQVRLQDYAVDDQEGSVGIYCLAVPVRNHEGKITFAISASGALPIFNDESVPKILENLKRGALKISYQLGWNGGI
jgi:DNA-binding IclR family transcriptional regulator